MLKTLSRSLTRWDRHEFAVLSSRLVSLGIGPIVAVAAGMFFSPSVRGYYFAFSSLLGAQALFESGISTVLIQLSAHEAAELEVDLFGKLEGAEVVRRRLAGIFSFAMKWYSSLAGLMILVVGAGGWITFRSNGDLISWKIPWILLLIAGGADFMLQPYFSLLEGCGNIIYVYRYRTLRAIISGGGLVFCVVFGFDLFSGPIAMAIGVSVGFVFVIGARKFFSAVSKIPSHGEIRWRTDIFPFQWRIAVSWIAGYFTIALFTPIVLSQDGAIAAGKMGMTIAIFNAFTSVSTSFVQAHFPRMGRLASSRLWEELDKIFWKKAILSISLFIFLMSGFLGAVIAAKYLGIYWVDRVLSPSAMTILGIGYTANHAEGILAFYIRCQKREPYFVLEVVGGGFIFLSSILLGRWYGTVGIVMGYCIMHVVCIFPTALWIVLSDRRSKIKLKAV